MLDHSSLSRADPISAVSDALAAVANVTLRLDELLPQVKDRDVCVKLSLSELIHAPTKPQRPLLLSEILLISSAVSISSFSLERELFGAPNLTASNSY